MKKQILNLGLSATHDSIVNLGGLNEPVCISDFDAFVFDPHVIRTVDQSSYFRRQREIRDLVGGKGGIVICLLRQSHPLGIPGINGDCYGILQMAMANSLQDLLRNLRDGLGSNISLVASAKGPSAGYYRVLNGAICFAAYLEAAPSDIERLGGVVFALDSVPHPVGIEFLVGAGRVCFVPVPHQATGDRVGSAIVRAVEAHYGGPTEIQAPEWLADVNVPGSTAHDGRVADLERTKGQIEAEIERHFATRNHLLRYRELLYGYGKSVLEPVVRAAFRLLGFGVPEPDEYRGEWDVELHEGSSSMSAIGEVEGSEGVIDVDKFRQLLDYVQAEALEGRDHKGILIGNGYRLASPDAPERQSQFSNHALNGAKRNDFCLLPTSELFKAVCAVLGVPEAESLKIQIRDSILSTVGVWMFARENAEPQQVAAAAASSAIGVMNAAREDNPST